MNLLTWITSVWLIFSFFQSSPFLLTALFLKLIIPFIYISNGILLLVTPTNIFYVFFHCALPYVLCQGLKFELSALHIDSCSSIGWWKLVYLVTWTAPETLCAFIPCVLGLWVDPTTAWVTWVQRVQTILHSWIANI